MRGIRITGCGIAVPDKIVTNDDLAATLDTSDAWIVERTGIRQRHVGGTTSGLAAEAGLAAIKGAAPEHGRDVQRLFFDHLTERQVAQLSAISRRVLEGLLPEDLL